MKPLKAVKIIISILFIFMPLNSVLSAEPDELCDKKIIEDLLRTRIEEYEIKKQELDSLLHGTFTGKFDTGKYFSFDIDNEKAVENYFEAIQNNPDLVFKKEYPQCADRKSDFDSLFNKLQSLHHDILKLESHLLTLSPEQRKVLINFTNQISKSDTIIDQLRKEQKDALTDQYDAVESIKSITARQPAAHRSVRVLNDRIIALEKTRIRLSFRIIDIAQHYEKKYLHFKNLNDKLNNSLLLLSTFGSYDAVQKEYSKVISLWREIVDLGIRAENISTGISYKDGITIPDRISPDAETAAPDQGKKYAELYEKILRLNQIANFNIKDKQLQYIQYHYNLIKDAGNIRSKYFLLLMEAKNKGSLNSEILKYNNQFFSDILREIKIIPYRALIFFINRWENIKIGFTSGLPGFFNLAKSLFLILLIICVPFFLFYSIKRLLKQIENFRRNLIYAKKLSGLKIKFSQLLTHINPYLPYIIIYFSITIIDSFIQNTYIHELTEIIPYFRILIIYRILMTLFDRSFKKIIIRSSIYSLSKYDNKIKKTGKIIGLFFLIAVLVLYAVEGSAGKAYIYYIAGEIFYYTAFLILLLTAIMWKNEILTSFENSFKLASVQKIVKISKGPAAIITILPLLIFLAITRIITYLKKHLFELELAKKTIARILRRQMEAAGAEIQVTDIDTLPEEYRNLFSLGVPKNREIWIYPHTDDFNTAYTIIKEWINYNTEEISLAVYGEKGIGKSSLFEQLSVKISSEYPETVIIKKTVPPKITTGEGIVRFFEELLDTNLNNNIESLIEWDNHAARTILFLDDAHNFFISEVGGFAGYKTLVKLINLRLNNLFICASFNIHSWIFLEGVFFQNRYFRNVIEMCPWNEEDIRKLINSRNVTADVKLRYDNVISATLRSSELESSDNIEKRFFRLLWEQSEGNPRAAIYMWLTCLIPKNNILVVGLPHDPETDIFKNIQNDAFFIYASIIKHENITSSELVNTTDFPRGIVKYALKIGIERDFLYRDENGRYRINPACHSIVVNYLKQRNLLYVN
ncbi:MAG: hypothetical protein JW864_02995 [Spirochaetes bacterium]|nr:hypothetical protein [Spirochaetota bacterium]